MPKQLLFLEFNELNFEYVLAYIARGELPAFRAFLDRHGFSETTSEERYEELEPWIQWVTAHTGLSFEEHGVFRLGDIVTRDLQQIWERLEQAGFKVGAMSPMNAKCRLKEAAFFIPDPWTSTEVVAPPVQRRLYEAIARLVNDNADLRPTLRDAVNLAVGGTLVASPRNYSRYLRYLKDSYRQPWSRALFLDLLLTDLFNRSVARTRPEFATLFLNAGAHIQHHYMFSSAVYSGPHRNPPWYVDASADPLLDVYRLYDHVLSDVQRRFPRARIMMATGLHQVPHPELTLYWRLRDHRAFLERIGVPFSTVSPRMSRDFLVSCADAAQAEQAARRLDAARTADGIPLFEVDNRGADLFVTLVYPHDIPADLAFFVGNEHFGLLAEHVTFVAVKNGRHDGVGYFADSGRTKSLRQDSFQLRTLPDRIVEALAA